MVMSGYQPLVLARAWASCVCMKADFMSNQENETQPAIRLELE